jgi:hypothetical protein
MAKLREELQQFREKLHNQLEELPAKVAEKITPPPQSEPAKLPDPPLDELAKQLREQMFWIYTVLITLSLRQVMVDVLPRVLPIWFVDPPQALVPWSDIWWLESLRLIVFLMMITRFFLGSVVFFKNPSKEYKQDVFVGYLHFLVFFAWSLTLTSHAPGWWGLSAYLWALAIVLLFGLAYRISPSWTPGSKIKTWALRNLLTVLLSFGLALIFNYFQDHELYVELPALIVVLYVTLVDFREMFENKDPVLLPWLFRSGGRV